MRERLIESQRKAVYICQSSGSHFDIRRDATPFGPSLVPPQFQISHYKKEMLVNFNAKETLNDWRDAGWSILINFLIKELDW